MLSRKDLKKIVTKRASSKASAASKAARSSNMSARRGPAPTRQAQYASAVSRSFGSGRENKTFDAVVLGTNILRASTDDAVAISASGYITTNSSAMVLNQVPQSTTSTTRIGRKMVMKGILLQGFIAAGQTGSLGSLARMCLVYIPRLDRTTTTMPPQNVIWSAQNPCALRVINNSDRFRIIRQWTHKLTGDFDAATTGNEIVAFSEYVKLDLQTSWIQSNSDGSFNDMEEGALCLYAQGLYTGASGSAPTINFASRIYFEDH
ncbi:coat protein [Lake Sarah-associated circular virus-31]|uniref:coat protein n=1 Tax=Lake Sarah-associated circular virus-31 TaxID=1685759 RepID=UPI000777127D|nr:coat protein [Lake Sarah-associated circular virus-31]ALE29712.1 coat protein [Lake Sarah-associated circular virus-31]ALE29714.1 coat protein [Lake Sarah-associated circular virus-31]ALE29716.1 coat protein [Lake Sarah-associated circular virus-31]ALE29718.1 coat protein [Lake Sarah-associated circular virus-31]ALE29720.1 coat protein [Lake Sarah-associated circular virus-31]